MKYIIVYTTIYPSASLAGGDDIEENIEKISSKEKLEKRIIELKKLDSVIDVEVYQHMPLQPKLVEAHSQKMESVGAGPTSDTMSLVVFSGRTSVFVVKRTKFGQLWVRLPPKDINLVSNFLNFKVSFHVP